VIATKKGAITPGAGGNREAVAGSGHFAARQLAAQPPWKRVRKARGPPKGAQSTPPPPPAQGWALSPAQTIDPVIDDALYSVDEIPPDDES